MCGARFAHSPACRAWLRAIDAGGAARTLQQLNAHKAARAQQQRQQQQQEQGCSTSVLADDTGVDYCRALCFLHLYKDTMHARQALLEELRRCPQHTSARALLHVVNATLRPHLLPPRALQQREPLFALLCDALLDYTMLSWPRLYHLYTCTRRLCGVDDSSDASKQKGSRASAPPDGHIVECGTAAGGAAVMMAVVLAEADSHFVCDGGQRPRRVARKVYALDTFAGMPPPGAHDVDGVDAHVHSSRADDNKSACAAVDADAARERVLRASWGAGTCSASMAAVQQLASHFRVADRLVTVPGLFAHTLPTLLLSPQEQQQQQQSHGDAALRGALSREHGGVALLHVDGDWYASTRDALSLLVPAMRRAASGSSDAAAVVTSPRVVQVDDYYYWRGCARAVDELRRVWHLRDGWQPTLHRVDDTAVYFVV